MNTLIRLGLRLGSFGIFVAVMFGTTSFQQSPEPSYAATDPVETVVERLESGQFVYVVFHALDRDGFCQPPPGAVSLHPVLGIPVDFVIESGGGIIIETSAGGTAFGRSAQDVPTFSTAVNAASANPIRSFKPLIDGLTDECQAWIKISQSIPGPLRVLVSVGSSDGAGTIQFITDLERETAVILTLNFRWNLVTWQGEDGLSPDAALRGAGGATDITSQVSAIYGWNAATQSWLAFFPSGTGIPGANNLTSLTAGSAYWTAISGPGQVHWSIVR